MRPSLAILLGLIGALSSAGADDNAPPTAADPAIEITLFAEHPDIVTPTGIAVDKGGRVFVIENHTHFRPDDYDGPKADRIILFEDADGDGRAEKHSVFYEGLVWGTDLAVSSDGWLYASTRAKIVRLRDTTGDNVADDIEGVVEMKTTGTYPHNGISGLCFDRDGVLHFGLGENLGHDYSFAGPDGTQLSGGGEGGTIYRCAPDGSRLERIATGVWNPFGMAFDSAGNLFATDNDPSSSPPCRLLHVADGADFGYEFRYGRSGNHPLVTWTGEFPGTVGMVAGTGEAPCGVIPFGPGKLIVASWADHRIDLFELAPKGASFSAIRAEFITGGNEFRPVDLAAAPDGVTFYFTDWVSSSYELHKLGRVWRFRIPKPLPAGDERPHAEIVRAGSIRTMKEPGHIPGLLQLADEDDPYIRSAAIHALSNLSEYIIHDMPTSLMNTPRQRAGVVVALKKSGLAEATAAIPVFLQDDDEEVRFSAVKWIADAQLADYRFALEDELKRPDISTRMFLATMAAIDRVDGKKPLDIPEPGKLLAIAFDANAVPHLRATALRLIPPDFKKLDVVDLAGLALNADPLIQLEAIRSLQTHPAPQAKAVLAGIAGDGSRPVQHRAEAIVGLALADKEFSEGLAAIADGDDSTLQDEALRALIGVTGVAPKTKREPGAKPAPADLTAWEKLLGEEEGDPEAGRRIFSHPKIGTCSRCHRMEGRGMRVGPDLTTIWKRTAGAEEGGKALRQWLLESILQPNATVAPQFLPWEITMKDSTTHIGLPLRKGGKAESYLGLDGKEFSLAKPEIASHRELQTSLMPAGLLEQMTPAEIRDLLAYLMAPK